MKNPESSSREKTSPVVTLSEHIEMYNVSGQPEITSHSFDRYLKDKQQDIAILEQAKIFPNFLNKKKDVLEEEVSAEDIERGLENSNPEIQKIWAEKIWNISEDKERTSLQKIVFKNIKQGLKNSNLKEQKIFVQMIGFLQGDEDRILLQKMILENIIQGLKSFNPEVQKAWAEMIIYAPEKERVFLQEMILESIKQGLRGSNFEKQKVLVRMIDYVPKEKRQDLSKLIIEKGLGEELIKPPLYDNKNINEKTFSRQTFEKTGSETTLVGGELKNKTIIRTIGAKAFIAWQRLYEDYKLWQNAGFDYVPIEPIQSYKLNKNGMVDVSSGVLDLSLEGWIEKGIKIFDDELITQRNKILKVLENLKIEHGHPHNQNFCLRFFRNEKGQPDFKRTPRLYLIDFDQAVSP